MTDRRINITQGEIATAKGPNVVISTLLGSCVACCLWDEQSQIGGMNHMLLAAGRGASTADELNDINEIEKLINALVRQGAARHRLQAKAFGGASMVRGLPQIGRQNSDFTLKYLENEGIRVVTHSLGGEMARTIRFWPADGRVMQRVTETKVEEPVRRVARSQGNGLELF